MQLLDILIESEDKHVVAHPVVQKYLSETWMSHLADWPSWKIAVLFLAMLFLPPVWMAFTLPIHHRFSRVPLVKFMGYLVRALILQTVI